MKFPQTKTFSIFDFDLNRIDARRLSGYQRAKSLSQQSRRSGNSNRYKYIQNIDTKDSVVGSRR